MDGKQAQQIRRRFRSYVRRFETPAGRLPSLLQRKYEHSKRVARLAAKLAHAKRWTPGRCRTARVLGLVHDIGRFLQIERYGTLDDAASIDHGAAGVRALQEARVLAPCAPPVRRRITDGVRYHNRARIPSDVGPASMPYVRIIRDADKLDLFDLAYHSITSGEIKKHPAITYGKVGLDGPVNPVVLRKLRAHALIVHDDVRCVPDFLVLQLGWVLELDCNAALRLALDKQVVDRIAELLPRDRLVDDALAFVRRSVAARLANAV